MSSIHLVFPVLPPVPDGIGDYTARLALTLASRCDVKVLTGEGVFDAIPGVEVEQAFSIRKARDLCTLVDFVREDAPDWLILQYNPFSYGKWGLSPYLPLVLRQLKKNCARTRIAIMVHEPFVPVENMRSVVMTSWQRWQLLMSGRAADLVFFSIDPWVRAFGQWFRPTPVLHLPVSSNIPYVPVHRSAARARLGIADEVLVVGLFGSAHPSRLLPFVKVAIEALEKAERAFQVLYVGACGASVQNALGATPFIDAGPLPADEVSMCFSAMDLYLAPFRKGVSSRRGSFMVGLQHGVPTISTYGVQTDEMLRLRNGKAFCLVPDNDPVAFGASVLRLAGDEQTCAHLGTTGQQLFDAAFSWERVSEKLLASLTSLQTEVLASVSPLDRASAPIAEQVGS